MALGRAAALMMILTPPEARLHALALFSVLLTGQIHPAFSALLRQPSEPALTVTLHQPRVHNRIHRVKPQVPIRLHNNKRSNNDN